MRLSALGCVGALGSSGIHNIYLISDGNEQKDDKSCPFLEGLTKIKA